MNGSQMLGRLVRSDTRTFEVVCTVTQDEVPPLGDLVFVELVRDYRVFGVIYDITSQADGLSKTLASSPDVDPQVLALNSAGAQVVLSVIAVGYQSGGEMVHAAPPRPPVTLDKLNRASVNDVVAFTAALPYLRRLAVIPADKGEVIAAHLGLVSACHVEAGDPGWAQHAVEAVIALLQKDPALMPFLVSAQAQIPASLLGGADD